MPACAGLSLNFRVMYSQAVADLLLIRASTVESLLLKSLFAAARSPLALARSPEGRAVDGNAPVFDWKVYVFDWNAPVFDMQSARV